MCYANPLHFFKALSQISYWPYFARWSITSKPPALSQALPHWTDLGLTRKTSSAFQYNYRLCKTMLVHSSAIMTALRSNSARSFSLWNDAALFWPTNVNLSAYTPYFQQPSCSCRGALISHICNVISSSMLGLVCMTMVFIICRQVIKKFPAK